MISVRLLFLLTGKTGRGTVAITNNRDFETTLKHTFQLVLIFNLI